MRRIKISLAKSGSNNYMYGRTGALNPFFGQHHTEETKALLRVQKLGKKLSPEHIRKVIEGMKGRKQPESMKAKMRGANNKNWKGDDVVYGSLHRWVRCNIPKPEVCSDCKGARKLQAHSLGQYKKVEEDWVYLCSPCHSLRHKDLKARGIVFIRPITKRGKP
jgi:hypothetical protein